MSRRVAGTVTFLREYSTTSPCLGRRKSRIIFIEEGLRVKKFKAKDRELIHKHYGREDPEYEAKEAPRQSASQLRLSSTANRQEQQARLQATLALKEHRQTGNSTSYPIDSDLGLRSNVRWRPDLDKIQKGQEAGTLDQGEPDTVSDDVWKLAQETLERQKIAEEKRKAEKKEAKRQEVIFHRDQLSVCSDPSIPSKVNVGYPAEIV